MDVYTNRLTSTTNENPSVSVISYIYDQFADDEYVIDTTYQLLYAYLIFAMQGNLPCSASTPSKQKNNMNIMLTNVLDAATGGLFYYLFGYAFSFGGPSNRFNEKPFFGFKEIGIEDGFDYSNFLY